MRLAAPSINAHTLGKHRTEVGAFRVVAAGDLLHVPKASAVLDVEQGGSLEIPGDDIAPPRELEVLVGLVDRDWRSDAAQPRCLKLAHRSMDKVRRSVRRSATGRGRGRIDPHVERNGDPDIRVERDVAARLRLVDHRCSDVGHRSDLAQAQPAQATLLADPGRKDTPDPPQRGVRSGLAPRHGSSSHAAMEARAT